MEAPNSPSERRLAGAKQLERPAALRLGHFSRVLLIPHSDPVQGVLVLSQDRLISKWQANHQVNNFSIGRGATNIIEFQDDAVSTNHLQVKRGTSDFYQVGDRGSRNGTFEEEIKEVHGESSVANNGWALTTLVEKPTLQIGPSLVRIEESGGKTYVVTGKRRLEIVEGVPFTIGGTADNTLATGQVTGNPFDRATLVLFNNTLFVNAADKPVTIKQEAIGIISPLQEATALNAQMKQELERERNKRETAERQLGEHDKIINDLQQEISRLRARGGASAKTGAGSLPQLNSLLRDLTPAQTRTIIHDIRRSFGKQLHPDKNPTVNPDLLKRANSAIDDLIAEHGLKT